MRPSEAWSEQSAQLFECDDVEACANRQLMAEQSRADWRPPMDTDWRPPMDTDWRRPRTLLRDVLVHLEGDADMFDKAEQDLRAVGGDKWAIGIGRYPERAERCREMATWVEDEYRALEGGHQRQVPLDDRGTFPGTLAP